MKNLRRTLSLVLVVAMILGATSMAFAAPKYIVTNNKAFRIIDLLIPAYKQSLVSEMALQKTVYVADDAGKTVKLIDLLGSYSSAFEKAPNKADEIAEEVKEVKGDLTLGEAIELPGKDAV